MMKNIALIKSCLLVVLLGFSTITLAQSKLPLSGFVTAVSPGAGTITIGETVFNIRQNVRVVNINGQAAPSLEEGELTVGTYIEFKANREEPVRRITVISLPKP